MVALERELPVVEAPPSTDAIPLALRRRGGTPRQVFTIALIGTLLLLVFASRDLSTWLNRLGDGALLVPLQHAAVQWDHTMKQTGFARPSADLRRAVNRALDWQW